jgi:hypothetical protein
MYDEHELREQPRQCGTTRHWTIIVPLLLLGIASVAVHIPPRNLGFMLAMSCWCLMLVVVFVANLLGTNRILLNSPSLRRAFWFLVIFALCSISVAGLR